MTSDWISRHNELPDSVLSTTSVLQEDAVQIPEMINAISGALNEMRVNYEDNIRLKPVDEANNKLLMKRKKKRESDGQ